LHPCNSSWCLRIFTVEGGNGVVCILTIVLRFPQIVLICICNKLEFLVKWEGYTNENNSWEPEDNCKNVRNAIATFYCKYPQAPRRIAQMQFNNLNFQPYQNFTQPNTLIVSHLEVEVQKGGNVRRTLKLNSLFFFIYFCPVEPKCNSKCSQSPD